MKISGKILSLIFTSFFISQAAAVEWGGLADSNTEVSGKSFSKDDLALDETVDASLWIRVPFNEQGNSYFTAEACYQFDKIVPLNSDLDSPDPTNYIDIDLFKFVFEKEIEAGKFSANIGRFSTSDLSSIIYTQAADGFFGKFSGTRFEASLYGAYTGLLNGNMVSILDAPDFEGCDSEKFYDFADKYLVAMADFSLPNFAANQTLSAQAIGTFRLVDENYNRMYGTLMLTGPMVSSFFYGLSSSAAFVKYSDSDMELSNLTKFYLACYPDYKSASVTLSGTYASGKQGPFDSFKGFTKSTAVNSMNEEDYSGLVKAGISATIKPVDILLLSASCDFVNFFENEELSVEKHKGIQYKIGADWQLFSDVLINASFSQYADFDQDSDNKVSAQIKAVITF